MGETSAVRDQVNRLLQKDERQNRDSRPDNLYSWDARGIEFKVEGREALPDVVQARVNNMQDQMYSGFLSELNLAWISVDDTICLWLPALHDGPRPPPCSKTCKDYVLAVTLVKPDPNKEYNCDGMPQYFLAVALRECVQLFKLEVTDVQISVQDTAIQIAVDSYVKCMLSTPTGRLFVGCNDGQVYELHYEEDDVSLSSFWRPRKFRKTSCNSAISRLRANFFWNSHAVIDICFDPTRHYLYALTAKASDQPNSTRDSIAANTCIHVYCLTSRNSSCEGKSQPTDLGSKSLHDLGVLRRFGSDAGGRLNDVLDKDVLSIHPVYHSELDDSHLVLITGSGWRIYIGLNHDQSFGIRRMYSPPWAPQSRAPQVALLPSQGPPRVRCCMYKNGLFFLGCNDGVQCVARRVAPSQEGAAEVHQMINASQLSQDPHGASLELWQIAEITTRGRIGTVSDIWGPNSVAGSVPSVNEQWTQHVCPPRRFICIGAREVVLIHRLQPWEKLRALSADYEFLRRQQDQPDDLAMSMEQKCASLLLWWVRAGGSGAEADHAKTFFDRVAREPASHRDRALAGVYTYKALMHGHVCVIRRNHFCHISSNL